MRDQFQDTMWFCDSEWQSGVKNISSEKIISEQDDKVKVFNRIRCHLHDRNSRLFTVATEELP